MNCTIMRWGNDLVTYRPIWYLDKNLNFGRLCGGGCASSNSSFGSFGSTRLVVCVSACEGGGDGLLYGNKRIGDF